MNAPYREGSLSSKICIIGEAPGEKEVAEQRPFVGASGDALNRFLASARIIRSECYFDNVMQIRPPANNIGVYITFKATGKVVTTPTFEEHRIEFMRRMWQTSANIYIPLGNVPLYVLTGLSKISKRRGSILEGKLINPDNPSETRSIKVMPTIHPAASFREYSYQRLIVHDLCRAYTQMDFPDIRLRKREYTLDPSYIEVISFLQYIKDVKMDIAIDIEVINQGVSLISFAISKEQSFVVPFVKDGVDNFNPDDEAHIWLLIASILEDIGIKKIGQNIVFDATFLYLKYGIVTYNIEDTMIACAILYPDYPKGLDFITSIYCNGEPYYKDEGKQYYKNPFGSDEVFRLYNAKDSVVCLESWEQMKDELKEEGNWETYIRQRDLIPPLIFMQAVGILMNKEGLSSASIETEDKINKLTKELEALMGKGFNFNSPKQMQNYFYVTCGYAPIYKTVNTPQGKRKTITTDETALKALSRKGCVEASALIQLREYTKMKGTYYDVELDEDNRLRCSFNPVGTVQGRISSSKTIFGKGANLQNQPPQMKALMIADPGYILINQDLSQAENRVVAYIAKERKMIQAFEQGLDVHRLTAGLIFDKPADEVSDVKGDCIIQNDNMSERDWGKRANHALNYDLGYKKFAAMYEITDGEALQIVNKYHLAYPGIRQWHASIKYNLNTNRTLINCVGRKRKFTGRFDESLFKEAYSFIPQSTVADILNERGLEYLWEYINISNYDIILLNQIHDSIVYEISLRQSYEEIAAIIWRVKFNLERNIFWKGVPFAIPCDTQIGFTLDKKTMIEIKSSSIPTYESLIDELKNKQIKS